jgi:hypothetical protein
MSVLESPNRGQLTWLTSVGLLKLRSILYGNEVGLENRDYDRGDPVRWPRDTLYQLKLALTSLAGCGRSVGIVRLRTKTTEFSLVYGNEDASLSFSDEVRYFVIVK